MSRALLCRIHDDAARRQPYSNAVVRLLHRGFGLRPYFDSRSVGENDDRTTTAIRTDDVAVFDFLSRLNNTGFAARYSVERARHSFRNRGAIGRPLDVTNDRRDTDNEDHHRSHSHCDLPAVEWLLNFLDRLYRRITLFRRCQGQPLQDLLLR